MDEADQDEYVDQHSMNVIFPKNFKGERTSVPVRHESKRATLIHCICNDGSYTRPLLIVPRKAVDSVILKHQTKGFANTDLIRNWLETIFSPTILEKWEIEHKRTCYNGYVVLILDGMSAHSKALSFYNLDDFYLKFVYLVPHSSHVAQPLDLVVFSVQKLFTTRRKISDPLMAQVDKLRHILKGLTQASTTENIISAFQSAGIFHDIPQKQQINFNDYMPTCVVVKEKMELCYIFIPHSNNMTQPLDLGIFSSMKRFR